MTSRTPTAGSEDPPSPPFPSRLTKTTVRTTGNASLASKSPEDHSDENIHWSTRGMREPLVLKHPEENSEPAQPSALLPSLSLPPPMSSLGETATRSALAPRTDAQANSHVKVHRSSDNTGVLGKEEEVMMGVESRRSSRADDTRAAGDARVTSSMMTPPRPPAGDTGGSISDLVKPSRSFDLPRNPRDPTSPKRRSLSRHIQATAPPREIVSNAADKSIHSQRSQRSARSSLSGLPPSQQPSVWQWVERQDPDSQEQALFEQRLCEDVYGVAVRKINQNGKSNLRYVKCVPVDDASCGASDVNSAANKSVNSLVRSLSRRNASDRQRDGNLERAETGAIATTDQLESHRNLIPLALNSNRKKALVWGKKKDIKLNVDRFVCVRKGKTTERTKRNPQPASRLLSLITNDTNHPSLDIEAPTKLDRDKFARAFAKFLAVPLEGDDGAVEEYQSTASIEISPKRAVVGGSKQSSTRTPPMSASHSASDVEVSSRRSRRRGNAVAIPASPGAGPHLEISFDGLPLSAGTEDAQREAAPNSTALMLMASQGAAVMTPKEEQGLSKKTKTATALTDSLKLPGPGPASKHADENKKADDASAVSSLTGAGFDQEIVEELHQALTELRAELEASRAEAARAVKVAEQAIQSAENSNSKDWNSTVTHKAAEAAALAQKRSAEAMAKQRLAEERLSGERKTATFWRKQAEAAEEEAGVLQTRAAAAEVQRAAMAEELESERRKAAALVATMKQRYTTSEAHQTEALESALERNRSLLIELDATRRELELKSREANTMEDAQNSVEGRNNGKTGRIGFMGRKKKPLTEENDPSSKMLLASEGGLSQSSSDGHDAIIVDQEFTEEVLRLHVETGIVRHQYELLRRATADELRSLPASGEQWATQVAKALSANQAELSRLRQKLAVESATRRRLLHEVQDLRGVVRVYCRPRPLMLEDGISSPTSVSSRVDGKPILSVSSQETLLLHRDRLPNCQDASPMSFEFDGIFHDKQQKAVYSEMEELVLGVLDGYNVCIMVYGQTGSGKTHSILGDVRYTPDADADVKVDIADEGIQLQGVRQLFTVSGRRSERYQDVFSFTIVEVHDERLVDLVASTDVGESQGRVEFDDSLSSSRRNSSKNRKRVTSEDEGSAFSKNANSSASRASRGKSKLEIRTNHDGDTVVQGLVSVPVHSYDDVLKVWHQALSQRAARVAEQDAELSDHEAESHVIATLKVVSTNIATGIGTVGKVHFVDLAGADLTTKRPPVGAKTKPTAPDPILSGVGNNSEWKYVNKSLATLSEVVHARCQFNRSVPYRNSTLTHLLRDSLEADTKVLMLVCVSSDPKDAQATASALRFASRMRRVNVGKATKHTIGTTPS